MKFFNIYLLLFIALFCSGSIWATEINKINDTLYYAEKNNLFYVFEKVSDKEDYNKWKEFSDSQKNIWLSFKNEIMKIDYIKVNMLGNVSFKEGFDKMSNSGNSTENRFISKYSIIYNSWNPITEFTNQIAFYAEANVWVAYISDKFSFAKYSSDDINNVEMTMAVTTNDEVPFQQHMGIFRSLVYLNEFIQGKKEFHAGLALDLHYFAAKAMHTADPTNKKIFQINKPLENMRIIIENSLKDILHSFKTWYPGIQDPDWVIEESGVAYTNDYRLIIRDWQKNTILAVNTWNEFVKKLPWFQMGATSSEPYLVVDIAVLAEKF